MPAFSTRAWRELDMDRPLFVSIIIPTFNGGKHIEETLASCSKIRSIPIEIIVVDDGSTDGTPERLLQRFPPITLHRLTGNSGSGSAGRNAGLALAKGRYVKFLDHDDLIQPRGFTMECREALRTDADIVMSKWGVVSIDEHGRFLKESLRVLRPPDPDQLTEAILRGESMPYTAAALYKRSFVADERWDATVSIIDDYDWFCRLALKGGKTITTDTIAYFWRLHPNSIQGRSHGEATIYERLMFSRCCVYEKIEHHLESLGQLTQPRRQLLVRRYYDCLRCSCPNDRALLEHMQHLDPTFVVDAACEPDPRALWLIHQIGLPSFLLLYGFARRFGGAVKRLRRRLSSLRLEPTGGL
ncbi:MAG: glycosyltransferase family 2 protein [Cyanobium sp.]